MQPSISCALIVITVVSLSSARPDDKYTTKYNNVDIDEILKSDRLLKAYVNCLLNKGSCTPDALELKKILPEALENRCEKCHQEQRDTALKVIRFLIDNKRPLWDALAAEYDSDGKYTKKYGKEAKEANINL